jgi:hypothetical protein
MNKVINGKYFENFTKNDMCVLSQRKFKTYMKMKYNKEVFRFPDEAYVYERRGLIVVKILEKKAQSVNGSVETKLWAGPSLKRELELVLGKGFEVHYGFCVNDFLKKKLISDELKYKTLVTILEENGIQVLFGEDGDYQEKLSSWIYCD